MEGRLTAPEDLARLCCRREDYADALARYEEASARCEQYVEQNAKKFAPILASLRSDAETIRRLVEGESDDDEF